MGAYLQLKFDKNDVHSAMGSAWIMMGSHELSHDCGTIGELDYVIKSIKADLDTIRAQANRKFEKTLADKIAARE